MPTPPQSRDFTVLGRTVHAKIRGAGPTVLLVHGLGATSHIWDRFHLEGYRLVAVDLPGCGWSDARRGAVGPREVGVVLDALMDELSPAPYAIVGHSMGALAALEMALSRPRRIAATTLVDVAVSLPPLARLTTAPVLGEAIYALPALAPASALATRIYLTWLFGDHRRLAPETIEAYRTASTRPHYWRSMLRGLRGIAGWTHGDRLARVSVPTLVVWGSKDPLLPVRMGRELARRIPDADFVPLPGCGHSPPEEAPEALAEVVRSLFVRKAVFPKGVSA